MRDINTDDSYNNSYCPKNHLCNDVQIDHSEFLGL